MNFMLVHGAHMGGWSWKKVAEILTQHNHTVYTPTLTGLGERQHLMVSTLNLNTHIDDIANVIRFSDLDDIILVGHSYAGVVIAGVNEIYTKKIRKLIFLDSFMPQSGKSILECLPESYQENWHLACQNYGHGWIFRKGNNAFERWGAHDKNIQVQYLDKICDFSMHFLTTPIHLSKKFAEAEKIYIRCTKPSDAKNIMQSAYETAVKQGWKIHEIDADHIAPITAPEKVAELLLKLQ